MSEIDLQKALDQVDSGEYIEKLLKRKKRYFYKNIGKHIRLEMLLYQVSFQISYSFYQDDEFPNLFSITLVIFSLNIDW